MLLASFFANGVIKKSFYFRHEIKITVLLGIANGVYFFAFNNFWSKFFF